jgi:WD40 repeat protein
VHAVRFNRFHDQLIVSAGTELVNLWNILSVSSAPLGELETAAVQNTTAAAGGAAHGSAGAGANSGSSSGGDERNSDRLIKTYSDHEDSIYAICWSACDAWIFASLSYDGRVVINHVPPAEKYKILL